MAGRRWRGMSRWVAVRVVLGGTVLAACGSSKTTSEGTVPLPQAHSFSGLRSVGPLFPPGSSIHTCTASVIASRTGDLVITAAHCLSGSGAGWRFVPGYDNGVEPYGSWNVVGLYGAPAWLHSTLASSDYAIVKVAPRVVKGKERILQDVVGANRLATAPVQRGDRDRAGLCDRKERPPGDLHRPCQLPGHLSGVHLQSLCGRHQWSSMVGAHPRRQYRGRGDRRSPSGWLHPHDVLQRPIQRDDAGDRRIGGEGSYALAVPSCC